MLLLIITSLDKGIDLGIFTLIVRLPIHFTALTLYLFRYLSIVLFSYCTDFGITFFLSVIQVI